MKIISTLIGGLQFHDKEWQGYICKRPVVSLSLTNLINEI
jgi:hypothetical protein